MKVNRIFLQICVLWALAMPLVARAQFILKTNANNTISIAGYRGSGTVLIPETIGGFPVVSIGNKAFDKTGVANVLVPDSVVEIDSGAFYECESLTNVTLGTDVSQIDTEVFALSSNLVSVCFRGNVPQFVGHSVYYNNSATFYYLPGTTGWGATVYGHPAVLWDPTVQFEYTTNSDGISLTVSSYIGYDGTATVPDSINFLPVSSIGADTLYFNDFYVTNIIIPDSVTNIEDFAFEGCGDLAYVNIGSGVANISQQAFIECYGIVDFIVDPNNRFFSDIDGVLYSRDQKSLFYIRPT